MTVSRASATGRTARRPVVRHEQRDDRAVGDHGDGALAVAVEYLLDGLCKAVLCLACRLAAKHQFIRPRE